MSEKTVKEVLAEVRLKMANLQAELQGLRAVEVYLANGTPAQLPVADNTVTFTKPDVVPGKKKNKYSGMRKADAIEAMLAEKGVALGIGDLIDALHAEGFETNIARNKQFNAFYTAIARKPDVFVKLGSKAGTKYALTAWGGKDSAT